MIRCIRIKCGFLCFCLYKTPLGIHRLPSQISRYPPKDRMNSPSSGHGHPGTLGPQAPYPVFPHSIPAPLCVRERPPDRTSNRVATGLAVLPYASYRYLRIDQQTTTIMIPALPQGTPTDHDGAIPALGPLPNATPAIASAPSPASPAAAHTCFPIRLPPFVYPTSPIWPLPGNSAGVLLYKHTAIPTGNSSARLLPRGSRRGLKTREKRSVTPSSMIGEQEDRTGTGLSSRLPGRRLMVPCYWPKAINRPPTTASGVPGPRPAVGSPPAEPRGASGAGGNSADTPEVFFRPGRDLFRFLPWSSRDESLGWCLSPSALGRGMRISAEFLIFAQHTGVEKRLLMVE
jgi:hypothetical protein